MKKCKTVRWFRMFFLCIMISVFVAGCSGKKNNDTDRQEDAQTEDVDSSEIPDAEVEFTE